VISVGLSRVANIRVRVVFVAVAVAMLASALFAAVALPAAVSGKVPARAAPVYGVTIDDISHPSALLAALRALPVRWPTTRVVFDVGEPAAAYASVTRRIARVGPVMGDLLDSSEETAIPAAAMRRRAIAYVRALRRTVSIWEVGNEVNGSWTGPVTAVVAKLAAADAVVTSAGAPAALTLYANEFGPDHCGDGAGERTPLQFAPVRVEGDRAESAVRAAVLLTDPVRRARAVIRRDHGSDAPPARALLKRPARLRRGRLSAARLAAARALQIMRWAYGLQIDLPYYIGGYFWWYGAEDALRPGARLRSALGVAMIAERSALTGRPIPH
jgi:hypothetical protein